jgi:hypothetical protein
MLFLPAVLVVTLAVVVFALTPTVAEKPAPDNRRVTLNLFVLAENFMKAFSVTSLQEKSNGDIWTGPL